MGFPGGSSGKESACISRLVIKDEGLIPGLGRCPAGGHGNPLQCSCLENPMDRGDCQAAVYGAAQSQTWLKWLSMHSWTQLCRCHQSYGRKVRRNQRASWWRWKRRVKSWLKTQHSETKIVASSPITSWQIDGETMETVIGFLFMDSKITADSAYSHEIKRHLFLRRKAMTNLDCIKRQRYYFADEDPCNWCNQFSSVTQSCLTICNPMNCSTPGLPVHHQLTEFTQTHVFWIHGAIQPSHPLSSPSPPTFNLF